MGKFITRLYVEVIGDRSFILTAPLRYQSDDGNIYEAPAGQLTDFGSTWNAPFISNLLDGRAVFSCVLHDFHYRSGKVPRLKADDLLREGALSEGQTKLIANLFWEGVRTFGKPSYKGRADWAD